MEVSRISLVSRNLPPFRGDGGQKKYDKENNYL